MKRKALFFFAIIITGGYLFGQKADQGKKYLYYHRYQSARNVFEKYWKLIQAMLKLLTGSDKH